MACLIAGINPKGAAAGTSLTVGDEVLEVGSREFGLLSDPILNRSATISGKWNRSPWAMSSELLGDDQEPGQSNT